MPVTDAQRRSNAKHDKENWQYITFKSRIGASASIDEAAKALGLSKNGFIRMALSLAVKQVLGCPMEPISPVKSSCILSPICHARCTPSSACQASCTLSSACQASCAPSSENHVSCGLSSESNGKALLGIASAMAEEIDSIQVAHNALIDEPQKNDSFDNYDINRA